MAILSPKQNIDYLMLEWQMYAAFGSKPSIYRQLLGATFEKG